MRPITVLHLRDTHEIGGPGKTILETFRAIDASRFRMHLAVFLTRGEPDSSPFISAGAAYGLPVHVLRGYNQYDPRLITRVAGLVDALEVDILHAHEVKSDVITYATSFLRPRVPIVTTLHGWIGNSRKQRILTALDKRIARRFDRAIVVSGRIHEDMRTSGASGSNLRLLHNAIVLDRYRKTGRTGELARIVGRPVPAPIVVSIGRLSPEKGHADLLEALAIVRDRGQRLSVVLAGDGPARQRLEQMIHTLGLSDSVFLPGYVDPPQNILEEADLMVLPSHTEGLPNAALEALAMQVPVLATAVGGTPEVIVDGESGRLVPPRAPAQLAEALLEFLANRPAWAAMASTGYAMVRERFDFTARTRKLEAIYTELLEERRA